MMYTTKQVADKLHLKHSTVRDYVSDGRIEATKMGHTNIVGETEMQRLLEKYKSRGKIQ